MRRQAVETIVRFYDALMRNDKDAARALLAEDVIWCA